LEKEQKDKSYHIFRIRFNRYVILIRIFHLFPYNIEEETNSFEIFQDIKMKKKFIFFNPHKTKK